MPSLSYIQQRLCTIEQNAYAGFLDRLASLYSAMDKKYQDVATYYGFQCSGCPNNCCFTRFFHHTLLEYLYVKEGYDTLGHKMQTEILGKALAVCRETEMADEKEMPVRMMCPLNFDGLCILYSRRPMICRLHGIPHKLHRPGQSVVSGSGCEVFMEQRNQNASLKLNRTPFYLEMAVLEKALRDKVGLRQSLKFTVAQMIVSFRS